MSTAPSVSLSGPAPIRPPVSTLGRLRRRLRRMLRPPRVLRPTRAGWCFFAITACVAFAALNTGNNLLYLVLSLMLAFLVLSGVLSESALRGIEVRRRAPHELFAGVEGGVGVEIRNHQRRVPAFAIVVEDCLDHGDDRPLERARAVGRTFALKVSADGREHRRYRLMPDSRGALPLAGLRISTRFPFGLFSKSRMLELPGSLLVYPGLDPASRAKAATRAGEPGESTATARAAGAEVAGLREHRDGDSLRRIHWKASLRRGELLVRESEDPEQREVEVRLTTAGRAPGEAFEHDVRRAASDAIEHLACGRSVALTTDHERIAPDTGPRQRDRVLRFLALVEPSESTERSASTNAGSAG